jgi:two-component sensor histidine kinase
MASPHKTEQYLSIEEHKLKKYDGPRFFERKKTEEKLSSTLKEKETLLKEIHHRVKNNLQIISSLLKLHAENSKDAKFSALVEDSQNRIVSMALIHEMLYANSNLSSINLLEYTVFLFGKLKETYNKPLVKLKTKIPKNLAREIDKMIPIGLILNEVLSNSFKYAFNNTKGEIQISNLENSFIISDNGIGIPSVKGKPSASSFGIQLIYLLSEQIDAEAIIENKNGTTVSLNFDKIFW